MRKGIVFLCVVFLFSGCVSQKEPVPSAPTEQEIVSKYNMPSGVGSLLISIDPDNEFNNPKEEKLLDTFKTYGKEQFFPWLLKDIEKDINQLENITPAVAKYVEFQNSGINPGTVYYISPKLKPEEKDTVYGLLKGMDSPSQIEAAKAYGVNLEFNELEFLASDSYGAGKVFNGGYSDTEDKYVEEIMKLPNLAKYLVRGALNDDGTITQYDYQNLQWFETAYKRMDPGISNKFNEIIEGNGIGTIESIGVTEEYLKDPYDPTMSIIPMGRKFYIQVNSPGDYIENGQRVIKINTGYAQDFKEVMIKNPNTKIYRFFDDPLVVGSKIDYMISDVDGQYYIISNTAPSIPANKSRSHFFNFFDNYVGIGYETPIQISSYGNGVAHETDRDERWWSIYICMEKTNKNMTLM
jgi:phage pi2 protein 07